KTIAIPEIPVTVVMPDGKANNIYVDFSYDPLYDTSGNVDGILVTVNEITELVQARIELQSRQEELETMNEEIASVNEEYAAINEELTTTNEELNEAQQELLQLYENFVESRRTSDRLQQEFRLAVSTADLGSWSIDMSTQKLTMSDRLREIFGLPLEGEVTMEMAVPAIDPEFKDAVLTELNAGLIHHKDVNFEYPLNNLITGKRIWVRVTGKMFMDEHQMPKHFSGVFMDITERKLDEIRKNDFIGIVSHELKTPLTSIKGYLQLVNRQAAKENLAFYESMSQKAIASVSKMETLVKGFLNVARFGSGKIYLDMQVFDLGELLQSSVEEQRILTNTHTIEYIPCGEIQLYADRDKIGQVVNNFLSNAIKYSPEGSTITVRCEHENGKAQVSVQDQGMGVRKADIEKVFDRFFRVEEPSNRHIAGFGIGLYLCSEIIMRHQGRIWVESEPNAGSTFYFDIPVESDAQRRDDDDEPYIII
ncbi:MAG: PAS domain S-box protein, partial [Mucilaginibacter polytrichastri]|nr:PAS domain S-box protein [Mucilaginibacter polytrichastri]